MFTFIYALGEVTGAELTVFFCAICLVIAVAIAFVVRVNRGKNSLRTAIAIAVSALICDLVWFLTYFPGGEYVNMGIGAAYGMILYPICLAIGIAAITFINRNQNRHLKNK